MDRSNTYLTDSTTPDRESSHYPQSSNKALPLPTLFPPPLAMTRIRTSRDLPHLHHILGWPALPQACEVCGKQHCSLASHKYFAQTIRFEQSPTSDHLTHRRQTSDISSAHITKASLSLQNVSLIDSERQQLLSLWSQEWGLVRRGPERHLFPVRWIDQVWSAAIQHTVLLQSLLATSASMHALATNSINETAIRHHEMASRMLSQGITGSEEQVSDEHILASICMLLVSLAQGSGYEIERQFATITQLVSRKGGPHYLGLAGIVAELLLYADATQAVYFSRCPTYEMPLPALQVGLNRRAGKGFRALSAQQGIDASLLAAADSLCRTVDIYQLLISDNMDRKGAVNSFGYLSTVSGYQLARCYSIYRGSSSWNELICLALLLLDHTVLHSGGTVDAVIRRLEETFWTTLETTLEQNGFGQIPRPLVLWVVMTGLTPSIYVPSKYKTNAVDKMRGALIGAAISSWQDFCDHVLEPFVWMPVAQEAVFHSVWLEIADADIKTRP